MPKEANPGNVAKQRSDTDIKGAGMSGIGKAGADVANAAQGSPTAGSNQQAFDEDDHNVAGKAASDLADMNESSRTRGAGVRPNLKR